MKIHTLPAWVAATNCFIVEGATGEGFLVDAPPDAETIGKEIASLGIPIVGILLTHGHIDHTGAAGELSVRTGAAVYSHPDDDFLTLHPMRQLEMLFGTPPPGSYEIPETFNQLEDGQVLGLAGEEIEVRLTPGAHTRALLFLLGQRGCPLLWRSVVRRIDRENRPARRVVS